MSIKLNNLIKNYLKLPSIQEVLDNPDAYPNISREAIEKWQEMMVDVLKEGLKGEIINNLSITTYDPFKDGIASEIVGRAKFEVSCVLKAGGEDIKQQIDFIKAFPAADIFPKILQEGHHNGKWICLMENLAGYKSFHEYVFRTATSSLHEIEAFLDYYYKWLKEILISFMKVNRPNLNDIYINPRLIKRVEEARAKLQSKSILVLSHNIEDLLSKRILFDGEEIPSFNELMQQIAIKDGQIQDLAPEFSTFLHGDAHPANIMLMRNPPHYSIKLIDPNPSLGGLGDYMYDQGKMLHWLDMMGYIVLERTSGERIVTPEKETETDTLKVHYKWLDPDKINLKGVRSLQTNAFHHAIENLKSLSNDMGDSNWDKRLDLSMAAAYIGCLSRLEDPNHLAIVFIEGLKYLNRFVQKL